MRGTIPKKTAVSGTTTAWRMVNVIRVPSILPRKIAAGSIGAVFSPSRQKLSRSRRKVRCAPSVPANTKEIHNAAAADSGVGFSGTAN